MVWASHDAMRGGACLARGWHPSYMHEARLRHSRRLWVQGCSGRGASQAPLSVDRMRQAGSMGWH